MRSTSQYMVTDIIYETKNQWEYEQLSEEDDFIIQKVADILKDEPAGFDVMRWKL